MDKLKLTGRALGRVFNFRSDCPHTMHLQTSVAIQTNLNLKTWPKQLLGYLPLVIALPGDRLTPQLFLLLRLGGMLVLLLVPGDVILCLHLK